MFASFQFVIACLFRRVEESISCISRSSVHISSLLQNETLSPPRQLSNTMDSVNSNVKRWWKTTAAWHTSAPHHNNAILPWQFIGMLTFVFCVQAAAWRSDCHHERRLDVRFPSLITWMSSNCLPLSGSKLFECSYRGILKNYDCFLNIGDAVYTLSDSCYFLLTNHHGHRSCR